MELCSFAIASQYTFIPFILSSNYFMSTLLCAMWLRAVNACTNLLCAIHSCSSFLDGYMHICSHRYTLFLYWADPFFFFSNNRFILLTGSYTTECTNNIKSLQFISPYIYAYDMYMCIRKMLPYFYFIIRYQFHPFPSTHERKNENENKNENWNEMHFQWVLYDSIETRCSKAIEYSEEKSSSFRLSCVWLNIIDEINGTMGGLCGMIILIFIRSTRGNYFFGISVVDVAVNMRECV